MDTDRSSKRLLRLVDRSVFETGAMCALMFLFYGGLYLAAGFELTVISMLAVIMILIAEP